jgi:3,4-dihydroxy 2-butanone 4-phosphate synthase/GTP cyclohydrolase II
LSIVGRVPLPVSVNPENLKYLLTKRDRMGHDLAELGDAEMGHA